MILILVIINLIVPIPLVVSRILDGLGKSIYSLIGTIIKIGLDMFFIALLAMTSYHGWSVSLGILCSQIVITIFYLILIKVIFNKMEKI